MASNSVDTVFSGGFGLATTNRMTDFAAWAGATVGDSTITPMTLLPNAGGITAWDAYLFGLDASHTETLREQSGAPYLGTLPDVSSGQLRFGARTNLNYTILQTQSLNDPWTPATPTVSVMSNGWNELKVTNSASKGFFRIGAQTN
jgi:hypothetical protein